MADALRSLRPPGFTQINHWQRSSDFHERTVSSPFNFIFGLSPGTGTIMARGIRALFFIIGLTLLSATVQGEDIGKDRREVDLPKSKLPEKINKAATEAIPGGKITDIDREIKAGKSTWEIGMDLNGKTMQVKIDDDGKVLSKAEIKTEKLAVADVPAKISDGVKKEFPGGRITRAEKLTRDSVVTYEMDVDVARKTYEVVFADDGKLVSKAEASETDEAPKK
jgi:uncharacterized membrane protein YkoI